MQRGRPVVAHSLSSLQRSNSSAYWGTAAGPATCLALPLLTHGGSRPSKRCALQDALFRSSHWRGPSIVGMDFECQGEVGRAMTAMRRPAPAAARAHTGLPDEVALGGWKKKPPVTLAAWRAGRSSGGPDDGRPARSLCRSSGARVRVARARAGRRRSRVDRDAAPLIIICCS